MCNDFSLSKPVSTQTFILELPMNTFGKIFTITTYGESHGAAIGGVVDGMPAGIEIDTDFIQAAVSMRQWKRLGDLVMKHQQKR